MSNGVYLIAFLKRKQPMVHPITPDYVKYRDALEILFEKQREKCTSTHNTCNKCMDNARVVAGPNVSFLIDHVSSFLDSSSIIFESLNCFFHKNQIKVRVLNKSFSSLIIIIIIITTICHFIIFTSIIYHWRKIRNYYSLFKKRY